MMVVVDERIAQYMARFWPGRAASRPVLGMSRCSESPHKPGAPVVEWCSNVLELSPRAKGRYIKYSLFWIAT